MTAAPSSFADLPQLVHRSQIATTEALEAWLGVAQMMSEAAGAQARNVRQLLRGWFDLVDQGFRVEREVATFLTIASRVSATAADSARELTDIALASVEATTHGR
jgi:hypothetical protein